MSKRTFVRAAVALVGLAIFAVVMYGVLGRLLIMAGIPTQVASPAAIGSTVAVALAAADVFTPLGSTARSEELAMLPRTKIAADLVLAGVVGLLVGSIGAYALLTGGASGLARLVVFSAAIFAGYAVFITRNLDVYRVNSQ